MGLQFNFLCVYQTVKILRFNYFFIRTVGIKHNKRAINTQNGSLPCLNDGYIGQNTVVIHPSAFIFGVGGYGKKGHRRFNRIFRFVQITTQRNIAAFFNENIRYRRRCLAFLIFCQSEYLTVSAVRGYGIPHRVHLGGRICR